MLATVLCIFALMIIGCTESSIAADNKPQKPMNVLLLCIDDLRPELNCFGASYIKSPNIDRLAASGVSFQRHYVNAPSCGPSRYTLLTGRYGIYSNGALFHRAEQLQKNPESIPPTMPEWFRGNGYTTVSVGKVSHHPGGRGGRNWDDNSVIEMPSAWDRHLMPVSEWQHPRGAMHGLAHGEIRKRSKDMDVFQAAEGPDTIYPDGHITNEAIKQLDLLTKDQKPFFLAVGIIRPHLPFGAPKKYLDLYDGVELPPIPHPEKPDHQSTWHRSGEFRQYNLWGKDPNKDKQLADDLRRHYAACVSYADALVGKVLAKLKQTGADKNTIVILWGDHGWHLGEHAIWGKHSLFEESLHSPLIVYYPGIEKTGKTSAIVETLDIFPTLCDLTGVQTPDFIHGTSLIPIIKNPESKGHTALGYLAYPANAATIRTATHRLIVHKNGFVELYDHSSGKKDPRNIATENETLVKEMKEKLEQRLALKNE